MTTQLTFDTMSEAVAGLRQLGYSYDLNLEDTCLRYAEGQLVLYPDDFQIDYVFRFEGETDPGDENVVYAIASPLYAVKGILVSAYGVYADAMCEQMLRKLQFHH